MNSIHDIVEHLTQKGLNTWDDETSGLTKIEVNGIILSLNEAKPGKGNYVVGCNPEDFESYEINYLIEKGILTKPYRLNYVQAHYSTMFKDKLGDLVNELVKLHQGKEDKDLVNTQKTLSNNPLQLYDRRQKASETYDLDILYQASYKEVKEDIVNGRRNN